MLIADALSPWAAAALCRLCFYYPQAGEVLAVRLLTGPRYDTEPARKFVVDHLLEEKNPERWSPMVGAFVKANGPTHGLMIPYLLDRICQESAYPRRTAKDRDVEDAARKVLAAAYPRYHPEQPTFVNAADDQAKPPIIDALSFVRSDKIDQAVAKVFRSFDPTRYKDLDRVYGDDLVLACLNRLIGKGIDGEFRDYCEKRVRELEQKQQEPAETQRLEFLREALQRLPLERR